MRNAIGERGEVIFQTLITKFDEKPKPRFRPGFLGDKWETVDFFVELVDAPSPKPYFFVQVKTTQQGFTKRENRLKVQIKKDSIADLAAYPAPTYVVGIDEPNEDGWLLAVTGQTQRRISSLPTEHPINPFNRERLYEEVLSYWQGQNPNPLVSSFVTSNWK